MRQYRMISAPLCPKSECQRRPHFGCVLHGETSLAAVATCLYVFIFDRVVGIAASGYANLWNQHGTSSSMSLRSRLDGISWPGTSFCDFLESINYGQRLDTKCYRALSNHGQGTCCSHVFLHVHTRIVPLQTRHHAPS